jgi:DtxR family manganese transport transcriptional regulator
MPEKHVANTPQPFQTTVLQPASPPNPMTQTPNQFAKTRTDHASETAEDYVEAIEDVLASQGCCRVKDLAGRMGVSHVTVTRILQRLASEGLVNKEPYGPVDLTSEGQRVARNSRARHELLLQFLLSLGVPQEDAVRDTEGMEHHVSKVTLSCMKRYLESD